MLEITVSEYLFDKYATRPEGELTKIRASIVCEPTLAICAREIELGDMIMLGKGEEVTGGRFRDSITSDAMEAVLGAIYRDGGIECARNFVHNHILNDIDRKKLFVDSKSILQERVQAKHQDGPQYELISESGPDHDKEFKVNVMVDGCVVGEGVGRTKKAATLSPGRFAGYVSIYPARHRHPGCPAIFSNSRPPACGITPRLFFQWLPRALPARRKPSRPYLLFPCSVSLDRKSVV